MRWDEDLRPAGIVPADRRGWALFLTDPTAAGTLKSATGLAGLDLVTVASQEALLDKIAGSRPDLVILSASRLSEPPEAAVRRVAAARKTETLPVILLTEAPREVASIVRLSPAAPLDEAFLVLRATLRRDRPGALAGLRSAPPYALDEAGFRILLGPRSVPLGKSDLCMLGPFFDAPDRVFERAFLERLAFNSERYKAGNRMIDFYLNRLRRDLKAALGADPIRTLRGRGYTLDIA